MPADYIITGAAQPLGRHIITRLRARDCRVVGIDQTEAVASAAVDFPLYAADVCDRAALGDIFRAEAREYTVVIHAAEYFSLTDTPEREPFAANEDGTKLLLELCAQQAVRRLVYVGSAWALSGRADGHFVRESEGFHGASLRDAYAKSKAAASAAVMESAGEALDCVVVLPTVLLAGTGEDYPLDRFISGLVRGEIRFGVSGGIDIVDVHDAAQGVLLAADKGINGRSYILSGHYATVRELFEAVRREGVRVPRVFLPPFAANALVKLGREWSGEHPLFTQRTLALLRSGTHYSHDRATRELGYTPRDLHDTLREVVRRSMQVHAESAPTAPLCLPEAAAEAIGP